MAIFYAPMDKDVLTEAKRQSTKGIILSDVFVAVHFSHVKHDRGAKKEPLWPSYLVKSLASMFSRRAPLAILFGEKSSINVLQKSPSGHPILADNGSN
ncbi:hypothetical protein BgiMline_017730 [Biomphalaria glabrata]|nr:hypothetical protein BgiMline_005365 [Biomphalaria glabrata]